MLNLRKNTKKLFIGVATIMAITTVANATDTNATKNHMTNTTESIMATRTSDLNVESIAANSNGDVWVKFDNDFKKDTCSDKFGFRFVAKNDNGIFFRALFNAQQLNRKVQIMYEPSTTPDANSTHCKLAKIMAVISK